MLKLSFGGIAKCPVCGSMAVMTDVGENLRESCRCAKCGATNRQRQLAYVLCESVGARMRQKLSSLAGLAQLPDFVIYNTESQGAIHDQLSRAGEYLCSEYLGEQYRSGDIIGGVMHQDLMNLSFADVSIDLVVSSDVFEHISDPYEAHREILRVLRPGGTHVFTVPFYQTEFLDECRTGIDEGGNTVHLKEPIYHGDPVRPEGALVHTVFSLEMLVELRRIGLRPKMYHLYKPSRGIIGSNAIVFEAAKDA